MLVKHHYIVRKNGKQKIFRRGDYAQYHYKL